MNNTITRATGEMYAKDNSLTKKTKLFWLLNAQSDGPSDTLHRIKNLHKGHRHNR